MAEPSKRYGKLDKPEEQSHIEVVEDPVTVFRAAHNLWSQEANRSGFAFERREGYDSDLAKSLYDGAVKCLEKRSGAIKKITHDGIEKIVNEIPKDKLHSGLFVSALFNASSLSEITGVFNYEILGYRLAKGKKLVAKSGSKILELGRESEGDIVNEGRVSSLAPYASANVVVNLGKAKWFGYCAKNGLYVNLGDTGSFGSKVEDGVYVNLCRVLSSAGKRKGFFGTGAVGGLLINAGDAHRMSYGGRPWTKPDSIQVNLGNVDCMAWYTNYGLHVNVGKIEHWCALASKARGTAHVKLDKVSYRQGESKPHMGFENIIKRAKSLEWIRDLRNKPSQEAVEALVRYDWNYFRSMMLTLKLFHNLWSAEK